MHARLAGKWVSFVIPPRRPRLCRCTAFSPFLPNPPPIPRGLRTSRIIQDEYQAEHLERPRWQAAPPRMTAPFRSKPPVLNNEFRVNEDPERLDQVYINMLGENGHHLLTEEVKWLAVTHKSFDHGRRGFNERLAFLGVICLSFNSSENFCQ